MTIFHKFQALSDLRDYDKIQDDYRFTGVLGTTLSDFADDVREFCEKHKVTDATVCDTCGDLMLFNDYTDYCAKCDNEAGKVAA